MSDRAAAYLRVSTPSQAEEGLSLGVQLEQCLAYVKSRGWCGPVCVYVDRGISGKSVSKRPDMKLLLEDVEAGNIKRIVTTKLDRMWRNVGDAARSLERIQKAGATLSLLDLQISTESASGQLIFNVLAAVAQMERQITGERIGAVNRSVVASGRYVSGRAGYGYAYSKEEKRLVVDDAEAEIVRFIFRRYLEGAGHNKVAADLNVQGFRKRNGGLWDARGVHRILQNPLYKGEVIYGRRKADSKYRYRDPKDDPSWTRAPGLHEPLIDPATWEAAWQRSEQRSHSTGRDCSVRHLLNGLVYCGSCLSLCYLRTHRQQGGYDGRLYRCSRVCLGKRAACQGAKSIRLHLLEEMVLEAIDRKMKRTKLKRAVPKPSAKPPERDRRFTEERLRRLEEVYLEGTMDRADYQRRRAALEADLAALGQPASEPDLPPLPPAFTTWPDYFRDERVPTEERRAWMARMVERVIVSAEAVTIHWRRGRAGETVIRR